MKCKLCNWAIAFLQFCGCEVVVRPSYEVGVVYEVTGKGADHILTLPIYSVVSVNGRQMILKEGGYTGTQVTRQQVYLVTVQGAALYLRTTGRGPAVMTREQMFHALATGHYQVCT